MHNLRCEHSTSDPQRCRCADCGGRKHGIQAPGIVGQLARARRAGRLPTFTAAELIEFDDRTLDALERAHA
jgi:hypothetical protein